jgi:hypothetical protein
MGRVLAVLDFVGRTPVSLCPALSAAGTFCKKKILKSNRLLNALILRIAEALEEQRSGLLLESSATCEREGIGNLT